MKTKITLFCLLVVFTWSSKAQTVTIPDANFVAWLQLNYPACMSGNQMDTTCSAIQNATIVDVSSEGISDLTGIKYFINLQTLKCYNNQLTSLPTLPNSLQNLNSESNQLTSLPSLPNSLLTLSCMYNQLTSLPTLPNSLQRLSCYNNQLRSLPTFPNSLLTLFCENNQLTSLPTLPKLLTHLYCNNNQLTNLPNLPNLLHLACNNNTISCFPIFPNSLTDSTVFNILGNPFTCLPNYVSAMDVTELAYPLCAYGDLVNNPNGCLSAKGIVGVTFKDNNNNCTTDAGDQGFANICLKIYDNSNNLLAQTNSFSNGVYFFSDSAGTYTVRLDTAGMPFASQCTYPGVDSIVTITVSNPLTDNINFDTNCKPGFDVGVQSVGSSGWIFPGIQHYLNVVAGDMSNWYNFNCAAGVSGQVQITVTGPITFDSIAPGAILPSISGKVFTYNIADYGNVKMRQDFGLLFTTDTSAQIGDTICVDVVITPSTGDNNTSNNNYQFCYNVVNSKDPNMKEVYPVNVQPGYQDWFTYAIHFQNTGNAPAMNIRLADTLDTNLDLETFQVINYSHYNTVSMRNNNLTFHFPQIMLADSASDPEGSKGFVQYRIKPKANLPLGTKINNTASIYFDYNAPIVTNTTTNEYVQAVSVKENKKDATLSIYPNPGKGKYFVKLSEVATGSKSNIEVYNMLGELIFNSETKNNSTQIDLSHQPNGIYIVRVIGDNQSLNQRIIKQ